MKKKLMSIVLASAMLISGSAFAYNDIDDHWAKPYIDDMQSANVLSQFEGDQIHPDQIMTREECAVLMSDFFQQYYGYTPSLPFGHDKFFDLDNGDKANKIRSLSLLTYKSYSTSGYDSNNQLKETKVIEGYPSIHPKGEFKPAENVTRAEFSKMLINGVDCLGYLNSPIGDIEMIASDADNHWGVDSMKTAHRIGIINGYFTKLGDFDLLFYDENGYIIMGASVNKYVEMRPDGNITRAEAIKMVATAKNLEFAGLSERGTRHFTDTTLYYLK